MGGVCVCFVFLKSQIAVSKSVVFMHAIFSHTPCSMHQHRHVVLLVFIDFKVAPMVI